MANLPTDFKLILPPKNGAGASVFFENLCFGVYAATTGTSTEIQAWLDSLTPTHRWQDIAEDVQSYTSCAECGPVADATVENQSGTYTVELPDLPNLHKDCNGRCDYADCRCAKWDGSVPWYSNNYWYTRSLSYKHWNGVGLSYATISYSQTNGNKGVYTLTIRSGSYNIWVGKKYTGKSPAGLYGRESGPCIETGIRVR